MNPKISVLLPVYNGEQYLAQCLDSILAQTLDDFELLCINDGSTDHTRAILSQYQTADPRVQVLDQENAGYGKAMNRGLAQASGTYIAVVEADDCVLPAMLSHLYQAAQESQSQVVKADYYTVTGAGAGQNLAYMQTAPDPRFYGRVLDSTQTTALFYAVQMTWLGLYRRDFLLEHQIWHNESPGASFQDNGFWFQVFAWAQRVLFLREAFYLYRVDNAAASTKRGDLKKLKQMFGEYDFIRAFLLRHPQQEARLYPTYLHFRFVNLLSRFFCAAGDSRLEIARIIQKELRQAQRDGRFSWQIFGDTTRGYLQALLASPENFSADPPADLNQLSWEEVSQRPCKARLTRGLTIPDQAVLPYLDALAGQV
mgnify:CR=1 FL=1